MKKKVAIIILNWNGYKMTVDCLKSLFKITYSEYKIFLVDNGSSDGSIAKLKDQFPNVDYLELDNNYGFTGGNNRGIEYARKKYSPEYILLLNNDTIVDVCFLSLMVETAEKDSQCGAVVPKIFFLEPSNHLYYAGGYLNRLSGMGEHYGWRQKDSNRYSVPRKVTFMNACASLIRMKVFESVGYFDERFFCNIEDVDLSWRINNSGFTINYQPLAHVWHHVGYTSKENRGEWFRRYLATRNILLSQRKNASWILFIGFVPYFLLRWVLYMELKSIVEGDVRSCKEIFIGIIDGLTGRLHYIKY